MIVRYARDALDPFISSYEENKWGFPALGPEKKKKKVTFLTLTISCYISCQNHHYLLFYSIKVSFMMSII